MWNNNYIDILRDKREKVLEAGGQKRKDKQHEAGKMTARERLQCLFDAGTFQEVNDMVSTTARDFGMESKAYLGDGVITGYGKINGRLAFASSQDFTVIGGALGEAHAAKICHIMDIAMEMKAPFINLNDSGGARIEEGICSLNGYAGIFRRNTKASGVIPQIAVILGPCAGGACYSPAICDFIFMTRESSKMFITGPNVVKQVTGETVSFEDLGGAGMHSQVSGVSHFVYDNDQACLEGVRHLLEYLPQSCEDKATPLAKYYPPHAIDFTELVPDNQRMTYNMLSVVEAVLDEGSMLEIQSDFAKNIIIAFGRMEGQVVGVVANQPSYMGGCLDVNASDKAARFVRFCDCFGIPLLVFVDVPGFLPGVNQEKSGIIRHGAKLLYAFSEATVPKISVILRKAFGGAYIAMNSIGTGADMVYAWPIAQVAVLGAESAVDIIYRREIGAAEQPEQKRQQLIDEYNEKLMTPYIAAQRGYVNEVIMPEETRMRLLQALDMLKNKRAAGCRHGNIPL